MAQHRRPAGDAHRRLQRAGRQMGRDRGPIPRMSGVSIDYWTASDGVRLAFRETGQGRLVVLLHGLFSDAEVNWVKFGTADRVAAKGFRVIMPDLRAHGLSGKP